jgi:hypothetical protein
MDSPSTPQGLPTVIVQQGGMQQQGSSTAMWYVVTNFMYWYRDGIVLHP